MGMLCKQPNGKYCIIPNFGSWVDFNLSEQDIIDKYVKEAIAKAKEEILSAKLAGEIIRTINPQYVKGVDGILERMGFDKTYSELIKFIPKKPLNREYHDFTTYGECPNCGGRVQDGMGYSQNKCICGQMLDWS